MGLTPFVTSDPEQRDRGPFLVTKFVPDSGANPGYHASTRYRLDPAGFDGGIPPARRMELKLNVRASDEQTSSAFLSTDDSVPLTVALGCPNAAAECSIYVTRGTAAFPLADIVAPKKTWTHVVVEIPAATVEDGSAVYPTEIHVTVDSPGHPPLKKTAFIGGPGFVLVPSSEIVHIGLGRPNGQEGAWEVWYDDVAVTY
jgi:hypothetical protein